MRIKVIILLIFLLSGCSGLLPPYNLTEVAAIRVYNKTDHDLNYQARLTYQWTEAIPIEAGKIDFLIEYDRKSKAETLPEHIYQFKINLPDCLLNLNRQQLEANMLQPTDNSAGWNLYINDTLIKKIGCK